MFLGHGFEEDMAAPAKANSKRKLILAIIAIAITDSTLRSQLTLSCLAEW